MIKVSDFIFKFIEGLRVKHVFFLPGGGCMHLVDSLGRNKKITHVSCLHEQAAGIAALSYAEVTHNYGVALVTTGPGATNALTAVAAAWIDSVPLIVISGQVKRADMIEKSGLRQKGNQEVDIVSMASPITKYALTLKDPLLVKFHLEKAAYIAKNLRPGPVWIDVPLDVQGKKVEEALLESYIPDRGTHAILQPFGLQDEPSGEKERKNSHVAQLDKETLALKIDKVISFLNQSQRPVILAGNGIRLAGARGDFIKLIRALKVPVLTTWRSVDMLSEDDPYFMGRPGSIGQRYANFIQQNADLIICIGARLDFPQVGYSYENFARMAKKVVIDIDENEINKLKMDIDIPLAVDAGDFIRVFLSNIKKVINKDRKIWLSRCRSWKDKYPVVLKEYWQEDKFVNTYCLIDALSETMANDDILIPGSSGSCSEITLQAFRVKKGQRVVNNPGLGAMGFGLPSAIGASLAYNCARTVVSVLGDGGFQLNIQELETIARLCLPIKFFVLNNQGYGSIKAMQSSHFNGHFVGCDKASGLTFPDLEKISRAYGIYSLKIKTNKDIKEAIKEAFNRQGPVICEVMVNPLQITSPRLKSEVMADGKIVSKPLEDLWPFLEREEFYSNMLIPPLEK